MRKIWKRLLCNYKKRNWRQAIRNSNSKRRIVDRRDNAHFRPKRMRIESPQEVTLKTEADYGRIGILLGINGDIEARYLIPPGLTSIT